MFKLSSSMVKLLQRQKNIERKDPETVDLRCVPQKIFIQIYAWQLLFIFRIEEVDAYA